MQIEAGAGEDSTPKQSSAQHSPQPPPSLSAAPGHFTLASFHLPTPVQQHATSYRALQPPAPGRPGPVGRLRRGAWPQAPVQSIHSAFRGAAGAMAAQQRPGSGKPPGGPVKHPSIPAEWRIELPTSGRHTDSEFGGCRSIEAGYDRGPVLGQGTYGEVRRALVWLLAGLRSCLRAVDINTSPRAASEALPGLPPEPPPEPRALAVALRFARLFSLPSLASFPRSSWPLTCATATRWRPRRSRWTTRRRGSPSPPSARWVLGAAGWRLGARRQGPAAAARNPPAARAAPAHPRCRLPHRNRHLWQIKILSALAGATETLDGAGLLRNNVIGLREIVRSSSHKANNFKVRGGCGRVVVCVCVCVGGWGEGGCSTLRAGPHLPAPLAHRPRSPLSYPYLTHPFLPLPLPPSLHPPGLHLHDL